MPPERTLEIHIALLKYLLNAHTPNKLFPDGLAMMARELGVPMEEMRLFLHSYFGDYFTE